MITTVITLAGIGICTSIVESMCFSEDTKQVVRLAGTTLTVIIAVEAIFTVIKTAKHAFK